MIDGQHERDLSHTLNGVHGGAVIKMMNRILLTGSDDTAPVEVARIGERLGWIDHQRRFTEKGFLAADPLREYTYWEERGRTITYNDRTALLGPKLFEGKRVVELGCGFGVNLLTLQQQAAWVVGVELVPYYLSFTGPLAERAGVSKPTVILADATEVPLRDGCCDVVMALGAIQYMPFRKALAEVARLLAPGGIAIFVNSTLLGYLRNSIRALPQLARKDPRGIAREGLTIANMVLYPYLERRITRAGDPVYLPRRHMSAWLEEAGLRVDQRTHEFSGNETCWVAVRS
jgi:SAM-dependent methyltransferase